MLKKLCKHEFLQTWKIPTFLCLGTVLISTVGILGMVYMEQTVPPTSDNFNIALVFLFMALILVLTGIGFAITIIMAVRIYRNLFTDQGYLMYTLPVKPWQLTASKTLIWTGWNFLFTLIILFFYALLMVAFFKAMIPPEELGEVYTIFRGFLPDGFPRAFAAIMLYLVSFLISSFSGVMMIFLSVCLGYMVGRGHKVLCAGAIYMGISFLISTVASIATIPASINYTFSIAESSASEVTGMTRDFFNTTILWSTVTALVMGVGFYFLINYLLTRKLNME